MNIRSVVSAATATMVVALTIGTASADAAVSPAQQRIVWQHACEDAARSSVSPQEALVCTHSGFPVWSGGALTLLERVCEGALGGTYVRRSEHPVELAACFFDCQKSRWVSAGLLVARDRDSGSEIGRGRNTRASEFTSRLRRHVMTPTHGAQAGFESRLP